MEVPIHGGISAPCMLLSELLGSGTGAYDQNFTHVELSFEELQGFYLARSQRRYKFIESLASRYEIIVSSRSLNLGSTDELDLGVLKHLRAVDRWLQPTILHEVLGWSALSGHHSYVELPIPYTEASLELLVQKVLRVQECFQRKIALRNVMAHVSFVGAEFGPAEFLYELSRITGCEIVLDEAAIEWNHRSLGEDPANYQKIPQDWVCLHRRPGRIANTLDLKIQSTTADRLAAEPIPPRDIELKEGVFESEPRRILFDEITRGFGIRPNPDLAVFENHVLEAKNGLSNYNQQYFLQVRNILQNQYRALAFALSGQFDRIVVDYLLNFPPTEAFIQHVGKEFEYFIRENLPNSEMLGDLARLENSISEVMEEGDQPSIDPGVMMEIESGLWDRVIFKLNAQVRLVEANFDVAKIQKSILSKSKIPEFPKRQKSYFLVYRKDEVPNVQVIGRPEAKALRYAWDEMTFIKMCERISNEEGLSLDEVIQQTFSFIHRWAGLGLVKAFDFKAPTAVIDFDGSAWDHGAS